jgi:hypothetical protein
MQKLLTLRCAFELCESQFFSSKLKVLTRKNIFNEAKPKNKSQKNCSCQLLMSKKTQKYLRKTVTEIDF